jgi:type II secretory pathway component GspD/PulD (secretin)
MIQGFGITRTLSNPRITVLNNQQAVLTFAKNQTYYSVKGTLQNSSTASTASTTGGGAAPTTNMPITVESTLHSVPIGVILSLQPSINLDTQEVTMHVRPTLSTSLGGMQDPAVQLLSNSIQSVAGSTPQQIKDSQAALAANQAPIIQVRELDTILKVKSGEVMIIGGLIQHNNANLEQGLPFLSRIPLFGGLARTNEIYDKATETVILIQATIVPTDGYYHPHDKKVYEKFTNDPRPLLF